MVSVYSVTCVPYLTGNVPVHRPGEKIAIATAAGRPRTGGGIFLTPGGPGDTPRIHCVEDVDVASVSFFRRIRDEAVHFGNVPVYRRALMMARLDKLIAKEQEVCGRKQGKMQGQPRATPTAGPNDVGGSQRQIGRRPVQGRGG